MKEVAQILDLWNRTRARREEAVLATVIHTRGSSYRLPGARLLITPSGERAGSISGGCLEDDLVKKAWWLTASGPAIQRYDTTPEGEIGSGYGLGCNGIVHVYLERVSPVAANSLEKLEAVWRTREPVQHAYPPVDTEPPFVETITPPIRLLIFGAGDDAIPLTELASFLGWEIHVYDGRSHYARPQRFPAAQRVEVTGAHTVFPVDAWTVAVVMTHSYSQDSAFVLALAAQRPAYLGVLGPRKRSIQLLADAGLSENQVAPALHAPMGLDIGADGPHQVALSVLAEIQAFLNGRDGGELRQRRGPIHSRHAAQPDPPFHVHSIACF